ncbi:MAG: formate dehydrogenase subunit delta [Gammaproteobacteria bacterium]|jgi:formate dehydrogenase subunit delta|nr:formate dehydrogenase subunit delta [Gammaproteobacteria bacterium]
MNRDAASEAAHGNGHGTHGAHGVPGHATPEHLVKMANDIGQFFAAEPEREEAIAGIANHIAKFWTRRMREKLTAHIKRDGDASLDELPREALRRLLAQQAAVQPAA